MKTKEDDIFWWKTEIETLVAENGVIAEHIIIRQEKIKQNLNRINELRNLIKKEANDE